MKFLSVALFAASTLGVAVPLDATTNNDNQAPGQVTIDGTAYSGSGCPQGTVSTLLSPDKSVVTFGFDSFQATIGPQSNPTDKQKNCQLHLNLRYPQGFQLSIMTATYHGYVRLDQGVSANFISSYYFSQNAGSVSNTRTTLSGPQYQNGQTYTKQDSIPNSSVVWSPCGANGMLNINSRIALNSNDARGSGEMSTDDATVKFEQKLYLSWRRC
jgi:hypothetical protein